MIKFNNLFYNLKFLNTHNYNGIRTLFYKMRDNYYHFYKLVY